MLICLWCQHKCLHKVYLFQANSGPNSNGCQVCAPKKITFLMNFLFTIYYFWDVYYFNLVIIFLCIFFVPWVIGK